MIPYFLNFYIYFFNLKHRKQVTQECLKILTIVQNSLQNQNISSIWSLVCFSLTSIFLHSGEDTYLGSYPLIYPSLPFPLLPWSNQIGNPSAAWKKNGRKKEKERSTQWQPQALMGEAREGVIFSLKMTFKLFHKYEIKLEGPDGLPPPLPFAGMTWYLPASERGTEEWNFPMMSHWGKWLMSDEWAGDFVIQNQKRASVWWTGIPMHATVSLMECDKQQGGHISQVLHREQVTAYH